MDNFDLMPFLISLGRLYPPGSPILLPALGETFAERSGVLNLGTEGVMIVSAMAGLYGRYFTQNIWMGVLFGCWPGVDGFGDGFFA